MMTIKLKDKEMDQLVEHILYFYWDISTVLAKTAATAFKVTSDCNSAIQTNDHVMQ